MAGDYTPSLEYLRSRYIAEGFAAVESWQRKPEFRRALSNEFDRGIAAHDAEVAAQARADERERIAAAIEAECAYRNGRDRAQWGDLERIVDITFATAARIARTPDPNGDNT